MLYRGGVWWFCSVGFEEERVGREGEFVFDFGDDDWKFREGKEEKEDVYSF